MDDLAHLCARPAAAAAVREARLRVARILDRGVIAPAPDTLEIAPDVDPQRIAPGVVLHAGVRLRGARTLLGPGVVVGREGPTTVEDTVAGHGAQLDGGYYAGTTLLDGAGARSWCHLRGGTLLEEHASAAHCVGLKQTILFPFVTLGSLINFCDVLMAGGTSGKDHSEVGSGYIHFNFTPRGDKATPSLYGDVPRGVLLDQPRIFLGGLGATVGPIHIGYGAFLGPGDVYRRDVKEGSFTLGERRPELQLDFEPRILTGVRPKIRKNLTFIGNLVALWRWYVDVRAGLTGGDPWREASFAAARETVEGAIDERVAQLGKLVGLLPASIALLRAAGSAKAADEQERIIAAWPRVAAELKGYQGFFGEASSRDAALAAAPTGEPYVQAIQGSSPAFKEATRAWLASVVSETERRGRGAMDG